MDGLAPVLLIPAAAVVLFFCVRAVVRALRAERRQESDPVAKGEDPD